MYTLSTWGCPSRGVNQTVHTSTKRRDVNITRARFITWVCTRTRGTKRVVATTYKRWRSSFWICCLVTCRGIDKTIGFNTSEWTWIIRPAHRVFDNLNANATNCMFYDKNISGSYWVSTRRRSQRICRIFAIRASLGFAETPRYSYWIDRFNPSFINIKLANESNGLGRVFLSCRIFAWCVVVYIVVQLFWRSFIVQHTTRRTARDRFHVRRYHRWHRP